MKIIRFLTSVYFILLIVIAMAIYAASWWWYFGIISNFVPQFAALAIVCVVLLVLQRRFASALILFIAMITLSWPLLLSVYPVHANFTDRRAKCYGFGYASKC